MIVSIMQPTYLPWIGYFDLISKADIFVFLDDVQFSRRSWQQRNRILLDGKETMLTIPIQNKGKREQLIKDVLVDDTQDWRTKHFKTLEQAYKKTPCGPKVLSVIKSHIYSSIDNLSELNQGIIKALSDELEIETSFKKSSDLNTQGKKSSKLFNICSNLNASSYFSPLGSKGYIEEEGVFNRSSVSVEYQNFTLQSYKQINSKEFMPFLSIIDYLCNVGNKKFLSNYKR